MGLDEYRRKRDFERTREPRGKVERRRGKALQYVIQKHAARNLHYDFRLELDGVLKSWAVPKGPSLVPTERRMAAQVEDHPLDYGGFEGVIPKGEYGGGSVVVWDRGTWEPIGDPHAGLAKGDLTLPSRRREAARPLAPGADATAQRRRPPQAELAPDQGPRRGSARGGLDADHGERARERAHRPRHRRRRSRRRPRVVERARRSGPDGRSEQGAGRAARGAAQDDRAAARDTGRGGAQGDEWIHELKLDGYRLLVSDRARQGAADHARRPRLDRSLLAARGGAREAAARGRAPRRRGGRARRARAIELPGAAGSVEREPQRRSPSLPLRSAAPRRLRPAPGAAARAQELSGAAPRATRRSASPLRYSDHVRGDGAAFFERACESGVEGVVSKRADARYESGRTRTWLKTKCTRRQELVVVGWSEPSGSRVGLGALLLGAHDDEGVLRYAGKVGTGFDTKTLARLREQLGRIERPTSAVTGAPRARRVHWVEPRLVAEIEFTEWTRDGKVRHPRFLGLREDKRAEDVRVEREAPAAAIAKSSAKRVGDGAVDRLRSGGRAPLDAGSRLLPGERRHQERARAVLRAHGRPRAPRAGAPTVEPGALPREPSRVLLPEARQPQHPEDRAARGGEEGARRTRWSRISRR